jgi:serine/threonine-protein kinase
MATVYLVRHVTENRLYAMKILKPELVQDEEAKERFEREVQTIRKLRHRNVVSVCDFGKLRNGQAYIVMDFLEGDSLFRVLRRGEQLGVKRTCLIFLQICDAMAHAHRSGIVHRDLKPSNIILFRGGANRELVKIVDFGIAKVAHLWQDSHMTLTQDGQIFGSPAYMSPEQCLSEQIDYRADIYSVGCMMFECLTGAQPFAADQPLVLMFKHVNEPVPCFSAVNPESRISPHLESVVSKALAKDPNDRYQDIVELERALLEFTVSDKLLPARSARLWRERQHTAG